MSSQATSPGLRLAAETHLTRMTPGEPWGVASRLLVVAVRVSPGEQGAERVFVPPAWSPPPALFQTGQPLRGLREGPRRIVRIARIERRLALDVAPACTSRTRSPTPQRR